MSTSKKPYRISKDVREQIIRRIRDDGVSVTAAAEEHGVSTQAIYYWLTKGASGNPSWSEVAKLKKENRSLLELVGTLTIKLSTAQKKS